MLASTAAAPPMTRMQALALRLVTMPMVTGVAMLLLWLQFEGQPLLVMGYGALVVGVLCALLAPFLLLRSWSQAPNVRNTVMISTLAIVNVPVAFYCVATGVSRATRVVLTLHNDADTAWQAVQIVGGGLLTEPVAIAPHQASVQEVWPTQEGRLELHFLHDSEPRRVILAGYVTRSLGGSYTAHRDANGVVTIDP
jgi:hypothetical protein